jgi:hypothetical protein
MSAPAVPLYARLPEIYRQRDGEQPTPDLLQAYLAVVENAFGAIHDNIGSLYRDLFIETCSPWVIPYIGDLLGVSPLSGDPWTLRADVADTIELRRMKGTIHAIELLAFDLTEWPAHCVELREILAWSQHLNHQRPDIQSTDPSLAGVARGGTAPIKDPALLSLLGTPFDPFARYPDLKKIEIGILRPNLPALAIFLWRLIAFQAPVSMPVPRGQVVLTPKTPAGAALAARFDMEPVGKPVTLFNTSRVAPDAVPPVLSTLDQVPGPIPRPRITQGSPLGVPAEYVAVNTYDATGSNLDSVQITDVGLQFHLPQAEFPTDVWTLRGANLCAWETPLLPELQNREIVVDPNIGRVVFGVRTAAEATALENGLLVTFAYGAPGTVGAQPVDLALPPVWTTPGVVRRDVRLRQDPLALQHALANLDSATSPILIAIEDSLTHELDLSALLPPGATTENGIVTLNLKYPLAIAAVNGNRPVVRLKTPLAFRPVKVTASGGENQTDIDALVANLNVRLQGIYFTQDSAAVTPLLARGAVAVLEINGCTLDPGSYIQLNGTPAPPIVSAKLDAKFGFASATDYENFKVTPQLVISQTIVGPFLVEAPYALSIQSSIVDAGGPPGVNGSNAFAVGSEADPVNGYGPPLSFQQVTFFGRCRVRSASGSGGIFCHALEVWNDQVGCIRQSSFANEINRLPQNFACVTGVVVNFTDGAWNQPGYAQLALGCDERVLQEGPNDDQMGAFGYLLEAHKWRNLELRLREYIPAGARPELIPVA